MQDSSNPYCSQRSRLHQTSSRPCGCSNRISWATLTYNIRELGLEPRTTSAQEKHATICTTPWWGGWRDSNPQQPESQSGTLTIWATPNINVTWGNQPWPDSYTALAIRLRLRTLSFDRTPHLLSAYTGDRNHVKNPSTENNYFYNNKHT